MVETTSPIWSRSEKEGNNSNESNRKTTDSNWTVREKRRGKKHTKDSGFPGIVEAENEDSSFLVTEERGKQFCKH